MAYVSSSSNAAPRFGLAFAHAAHRVKLALARRSVYSQILRELNSLSDRELADLGVHAAQITDIAREAAYGK
jgi:uncharacterized protein YjiS (DUF1127 family)